MTSVQAYEIRSAERPRANRRFDGPVETGRYLRQFSQDRTARLVIYRTGRKDFDEPSPVEAAPVLSAMEITEAQRSAVHDFQNALFIKEGELLGTQVLQNPPGFDPDALTVEISYRIGGRTGSVISEMLAFAPDGALIDPTDEPAEGDL